MNQEYIKTDKHNYIVTDENGNIYKRTAPSPELFKCENDIEIVDNEIKSLESQKRKLTKEMKAKNIRQLLMYLPALAVWNVVLFKETLGIFMLPTTTLPVKILIGSIYGIFVLADSALLADNAFANFETRERKQKIDKSLTFAKSVKKKCERELEKYKARVIAGVKDEAKKNQKVSLKEENDYKAYKLQERLTDFYDADYYDKPHTLKRTR